MPVYSVGCEMRVPCYTNAGVELVAAMFVLNLYALEDRLRARNSVV